MIHRRKPGSAVLKGKIRQIGERMARLNDQLKIIRIEAVRSRGLARIRFGRLERRARAKLGRVQTTLRDCGSRLGNARVVTSTRRALACRVAGGRVKLQESVDHLRGTLAQSTRDAKREMRLVGRGLKAGLRAGNEAYRRKP